MKILVIQGHPDTESFTHANALNYVEAAKKAGHDVAMIDLASEDFDPVLAYGYRKHMDDESKPNKYQQMIQEADELAIFYPIWWAAEPAILKGFFDRVFTPGFAYKYVSVTKINQLLKGKTAKLFITSRAPAGFTKSFFGSNIYRMKNLVLGFVGIKVKKVLVHGDMITKKDMLEKRQAFMDRCAKEVWFANQATLLTIKVRPEPNSQQNKRTIVVWKRGSFFFGILIVNNQINYMLIRSGVRSTWLIKKNKNLS